MVFLEPPDVLLEGSDQKEAEIRNNAVASFLMWMSFISFSCLIAKARNSSTMSKRSDETGYPYFAVILVLM